MVVTLALPNLSSTPGQVSALCSDWLGVFSIPLEARTGRSCSRSPGLDSTMSLDSIAGPSPGPVLNRIEQVRSYLRTMKKRAQVRVRVKSQGTRVRVTDTVTVIVTVAVTVTVTVTVAVTVTVTGAVENSVVT